MFPLSKQGTFHINSLHKCVLAITNLGARAICFLLAVSLDLPGHSLISWQGAGRCSGRELPDPWPGFAALGPEGWGTSSRWGKLGST